MTLQDRTFQYWPLGVPLPEGWVLAGELHAPHGSYSVLIEWTKGGEPPTQATGNVAKGEDDEAFGD